uniref:Tyrosine-protein phosphatase non-receptor type substrate 1-like n=1 Tax=Lepisosteus oculatus TaxID=7918 RepID=W5MCQ3_LEPOC|nr:PREDICTED: uncharacterized protein LOC107076675 isoform X1 [Lepisosteus oculatus]XP_015196713.1 PREDICTED: uncharacterized protein LOC107076675 isoform X1 [Lepisosteus oculatus]
MDLSQFSQYRSQAAFVVTFFILNAVLWTDSSQEVTAVKGQTIQIECFHINSTEGMAITLKRKTKLCYMMYGNHSWWINRCNERVILFWNNKTNTVSFTIKDSLINDSDTYTCTLEKIIPPPATVATQKSINLKVIVQPNISLSKTQQHSGNTLLVCTAQGFCSAEIDQFWFREGQPITNTTSHRNLTNNTDGSFTLTSYLSVSGPESGEVLYNCWVNHSFLKTPVTVNITLFSHKPESPQDITLPLTVTGPIVFVFLSIIVLICLKQSTSLKRALQPSSVNPSEERDIPLPETPEGVDESPLYSKLGEHCPVNCREFE